MRVVLWDGGEITAHTPPSPSPVATVRIRDPVTLLRLLVDPDVAFGDGYANGRIEVEGDLVRLLEVVFTATPHVGLAERLRQVAARCRRHSHGVRASRENVQRHYDLPSEFFRLWLDPSMTYTCAYFPTSDTPLAAAQTAKLDYVCRKLDLRPGERVIEAGCGWGSLALHMARHYGVQVRAFNVSGEQIAYARNWATREGLGDRVEFVEDDWRNISGACDAFVSIGMLEHVGVRQYRELGAVIDRALRRDGRGLVHTMGRNQQRSMNRWIATRVFPGGYAPTLAELARIVEPNNFSILDVENLRLHYAQTLRAWLAAFDTATPKVVAMFDERFARTWRLYLASAVASFSAGSLQLFQVLFARGETNHVPRTRARLYGPG